MPSAAITLVENPATIESDTNEATMTKGLEQMEGYLLNDSTVDTFLGVNGTTVVTTGAQAQNIIVLKAGKEFEWLRQYTTIKHKTAAGASILSWKPRSSHDYT